mgnify:FL=1
MKFTAFALLVMMAGWGCNSVTTGSPVTNTCSPQAHAVFDGFWMTEDGVFELRFDASGVAHFGSMDWSEQNGVFEPLTGDLMILGDDRGGYLSARFRDEGKPDPEKGYYLAAYQFDSKDRLLVYQPKVERFIGWIEGGKVKGVVQKGEHSRSAHIESAAAEYLDVIRSVAQEDCFDRTEPLEFHRVRLPEPRKSPVPEKTP